MLSIPIYEEIKGFTIFRDDADSFRFYYLPAGIRLARGEDGTPMFSFLRYQYPIKREGGEPGGGYLVFTMELAGDQDVLEKDVRPVLQSRVRTENPQATHIPDVSLVPVDFTDGEVRLVIMRDKEFVKDVNLGRPSLFANNTASIAVELGSNGATLFYEALRGGSQIGAIEYNLRFPVRLPAVTIRGHVSGEEIKEAVMENEAERIKKKSWALGSSSHSTRMHRTSISEVFESQGLIELEILVGTVELDDEDMESLRAFAFRAMDAFINDHFLKGGSVETEEDRRNQWMKFLKQDVSQTFDLNVTYRDVITRDYNPSATINPSFLGGAIDSFVLDIDLENAPWYYNNLEVSVDTNLDFDKYGDIVHSVVGHLTYDQPYPDGRRITKRESVLFTANDRSIKTFKTRLTDVEKDTYHVDVEVNYKSGPVPSAMIYSEDTTVRNLTLRVPNPGVIELELAAVPEAFEKGVRAIEADLRYSDPRNKVPESNEKVILDANAPQASYRRAIYAPWEQPLQYRFTYVLELEDDVRHRSTTEWRELSSGTRYLRVPTPMDEQFNLTVVSAADWDEVSQIVVDLDYDDDAGDLHLHKTLSFKKNEFNYWKFPLRTPEHRSFRYKQTLLMADGAVIEGEWSPVESDAMSLLVGNAPAGVATVEVDPSDIDIGGEVKRVIATLSYSDSANDILDTQAILFRDATPVDWDVARADASVTGFVYTVQYYMKDGTVRTRTDVAGELAEGRTYLFLPGPPEE